MLSGKEKFSQQLLKKTKVFFFWNLLMFDARDLMGVSIMRMVNFVVILADWPTGQHGTAKRLCVFKWHNEPFNRWTKQVTTLYVVDFGGQISEREGEKVKVFSSLLFSFRLLQLFALLTWESLRESNGHLNCIGLAHILSYRNKMNSSEQVDWEEKRKRFSVYLQVIHSTSPSNSIMSLNSSAKVE